MSKRDRHRNKFGAPMQREQVEITKQVTNEAAAAMQNGLADALGGGIGLGGGFNPIGFPGNQNSPFAETISDSDTLFKNMRWYLVSNFRQLLSEAYVEIGLVQTIVDVPVDDGLRGGIEIKSKQLSEEQIEELRLSIDRDDDLTIVGQAAKWNRLFGGAGILILTDQDPEEPLEVEKITADSQLEFRAVDMWELFWDKQNTEGYDPAIQTQDFEFYNYYGEQVHKSRVMRLKGLSAPSFIRPRLRGWGFSVVETLIRSINQYLKATDLTFEVLDEFKVDVYKIKNLVNTLLSPNGAQQIQKRIQLANFQKNYQNALTMDSEDDWDHKQLSFAGMAEVMTQIRMQVASDMRMPMLKLFGTPAQGLNAGDEDSIEVYNSMVESQVRNKLKYDILRVCEIKCQRLFGMIPDDLSVHFKPLRVMSAEQEENVKTQKFSRLIQAKQAGEITLEEFRDSCNKGNLFDITLDTTDGALLDVKDEAAEGFNDPLQTKDVDDPGANRLDTRKARATEVGGAGKEPKPAPRSASAPKAKAEAGSRREQVRNSPEFDRASYAADGGDEWIDDRRREFFENPGKVDEGLWAKAKEASKAAFGEIKWKFVTWWYKKQGGHFG
jgi:phage-related protein (TIGR01555 family)